MLRSFFVFSTTEKTEKNGKTENKVFFLFYMMYSSKVIFPFFSDVIAKNAEGMKEHRQAVKCKARNPCKAHIQQRNPEAGDRYVSQIICRTFGIRLALRHIAGVSLRFTACLCSVVPSGLAKPCFCFLYNRKNGKERKKRKKRKIKFFSFLYDVFIESNFSVFFRCYC